jgi:hypothetical protein
VQHELHSAHCHRSETSPTHPSVKQPTCVEPRAEAIDFARRTAQHSRRRSKRIRARRRLPTSCPRGTFPRSRTP